MVVDIENNTEEKITEVVPAGEEEFKYGAKPKLVPTQYVPKFIENKVRKTFFNL